MSGRTTTITKPFYMDAFPVTQKQYQNVTGANPSYYKGEMRPVECVSWNTVRGTSSTYDWPNVRTVDANSFMGRLQARTGLAFDLPTEAQWEYACRAGTTGSYNNGNMVSWLGRYNDTQRDGRGGYTLQHTTVGSYLSNDWGLYDMHGNVLEWCLDWYTVHVCAFWLSFSVAAAGWPCARRLGLFHERRDCRRGLRGSRGRVRRRRVRRCPPFASVRRRERGASGRGPREGDEGRDGRGCVPDAQRRGGA